jgi:hypothetical protein
VKTPPPGFFLVVGLSEGILGLIILVFGVYFKDGYYVALSALLLSMGFWAIGYAFSDKGLNEVKKELRKLRKQLEG